jgi:hypothetical protein
MPVGGSRTSAAAPRRGSTAAVRGVVQTRPLEPPGADGERAEREIGVAGLALEQVEAGVRVQPSGRLSRARPCTPWGLQAPPTSGRSPAWPSAPRTTSPPNARASARPRGPAMARRARAGAPSKVQASRSRHSRSRQQRSSLMRARIQPRRCPTPSRDPIRAASAVRAPSARNGSIGALTPRGSAIVRPRWADASPRLEHRRGGTVARGRHKPAG